MKVINALEKERRLNKLRETVYKCVKELSLEKDLISMVGYGSYFEMENYVDIDTYAIVKRKIENIDKIHLLKKKVDSKLNVNLEPKIIFEDELNRKVFQHRGRENIFILDFHNFYQIYGEEIDIDLFISPYEILKECSRNINFLYYLSRKTYVENLNNVRDSVKNLLRAMRFVNLFNFDYTFSIGNTLSSFKKYFLVNEEIEKIALFPYEGRVDRESLRKVLRILDVLDKKISNKIEEIESKLSKRFWYKYENGIKFFYYDGLGNRKILYLLGLPRYPPENALKNFRLLGKLYVVDYIHLIRNNISFDEFIERIKKFDFDVAICESFGSIVGFYLASIFRDKKFIFLSPVISFLRKEEVKKEVESLFNVVKDMYSLSDDDCLIYKSIFKLDPNKIENKNLDNSIAFLGKDDERYAEGIENFKIKKVKSNFPHGYKLIYDFQIWKEILDFVGFKPFISGITELIH